MSTAEQLLREGKLDEATTALTAQVRSKPADSKLRIFLFQLLAVRGDWQRALTQLNVAAELDPLALAMAQMYREAIRCEAFRTEVFSGRRSPLILGEPPEWIGWIVEAMRLGASGQHQAAEELRGRAFDAAPALSGIINDEPFDWIADADPRLGPVLEAIVNGRYYWVPVENIGRIVVQEPEDLRDVVWMPAHFTWTNGGEAVAIIPTRYPGSEHDADEHIRLARKTTWADQPPPEHPLGQRLLATDAGEYPLMDVRQVVIGEPPAVESAASGGETTPEAPDA